MFQALLESLLKRVIGQYVEDLDKHALNVSVYSGEIDLHDLTLKKDIFDGLGIPVKLILGRIKKLYIKVPWNALSSKPVKLDIEGVELVIEPLPAQFWGDLVERQNKMEVLEKRLLDFALGFFKQMVEETTPKPAADDAAAKQGFLVGMTTKVVDNIQVSIRNIHVRYEDTRFFKDPLSIGITLEKLEIQTTNEHWESEFIDRTLSKNKDKPLQKLLNLRNIGLYCQPLDVPSMMVSLIPTREEQYAKFISLFPAAASISEPYKSCYILRPISILAKFKQLSASIKSPAEPICQLSLDIDDFEIAFLKTQFEAVLKFFENVHEFQIFQDNFMNKKKVNLQQFYQRPEVFKENQQIFKRCLKKLLTREVHMLAHEGAKIPKDKMAAWAKAAELAAGKVDVYQNFIKYENTLLMRRWASELVTDNFTELKAILDEPAKAKGEKEQSGGMISYIGSWLGGPAKPTKREPAVSSGIKSQSHQSSGKASASTEVADTIDGDEFYDAVEHETASSISASEIERMSAEIYQNFDGEAGSLQHLIESQRQGDRSMPMLQAQFHLKKFKFQMVDDSSALHGPEADILNEYRYTEIFAFTKDLRIQYAHFDDDHISNNNQGELRASIADLGLTYVEKYKESAENGEIKTHQHRVLWKRDPGEANFIDVHLEIANKKLKQAQRSGQFADFIDQNLDVKMRAIFFEYRKEYIEFFMTFFSSKEEFKDELKLKALEEYEKLRDAVSLQNVLESREKESTFRVKVELQNSIAMFPIYRTIEEAAFEQPLNHLMDITEKSCWIVDTGVASFTNGKNNRCPEGFTPLTIRVKPSVYFTENLAKWWNPKADSPKNTIGVLEKFEIDLMIKIKDSGFKFDQPSTEVSEITFDFSLNQGHIYLNPLIFNHLVNISTIFKRPLASSGDEQQLKHNERKHIFQEATKFEIVRKKGNTIRFWYEYIAVFSGSYIYFYPRDDHAVIEEIIEFYHLQPGSRPKTMTSLGDRSLGQLPAFERQSTQGLQGKANKMHKKKQKQFKDLNHEESYLVKGCSSVQKYGEYIEEVKHQSGENQQMRVGSNQATQNTVRMFNSQNQECILEFQSNEACRLWSDLIIRKANDIDQFLKKDKFVFGNFGSIQANMVNQKMQEAILQEQLDKKNNFDHLVTDDPLQLLQAYEVRVTKLTIVAEGLTQFKLPSKSTASVDPAGKEKQNDLIILSSQVPKQLNVENIRDFPQEKDDQVDKEDIFQFFFEAKQMFFAFRHRELDNDVVISLQSLKVIDRSANPTKQRDFDPAMDDAKRYQVLLHSEDSSENHENEIGKKQMIELVFKMQEMKSPRYKGVDGDMHISISRVHLNWHPIAYNRFIRFLRFVKYPYEVIEEETKKIKQTLKVRLQKLQQEFRQPGKGNAKSRSGLDDPEKAKQRLRTLDMIEKLSQAVEEEAELKKTSDDMPKMQLQRSKTLGAKSASGILSLDKCTQRTTCRDDPTILLAVHITVEKIKLVCIHPQNDSYPIFTSKIERLIFDYSMHQDHDLYKGSLGDFKILDNTNHPQTLDPTQNYPKDSKTHSQQILGLTERGLRNKQGEKSDESQGQVALSFEMTTFNFPLDLTCPLQTEGKNQRFSNLLKLNIKSIKMNYMQEQILRLSDYCLQQLIESVSDTNPYQDMVEKLKKETDPFADADELQDPEENSRTQQKLNKLMESMLIKNQEKTNQAKDNINDTTIEEVESENSEDDGMEEEEGGKRKKVKAYSQQVFSQKPESINTEDIDLKQVPLVTGLDIVIENPQIIIKDRPYLMGELEMDLGLIKITSELEQVSGRWKNQPDKQVYVSTMYIDAKNIKIDYNRGTRENRELIDNITPPFDLSISYQSLIKSPLLEERQLLDYGLQGSAAANGIDYHQFQNQDKITIKSAMSIEMNIKQNAYKYILRCLDLNINYNDGFEPQFQFSNWGSLTTMKPDEIESYKMSKLVKEQFQNTSIKRREIKLQLPTISVKCLKDDLSIAHQQRNEADTNFIAELVLCKLDLDFHQFLDARNQVAMKAQSFYVLYKEKEEQAKNGPDYRKGSSKPHDVKRLILGPISSHRILQTSHSFYTQQELQMEEQKPSLGGSKGEDEQPDGFIFTAIISPGGMKTLNLSLQNLKLFLRIDQLLTLQAFFMDGLPSYDNCNEKPAQFDSDKGNTPKMAFTLHLKDSLICFEQLTRSAKSAAEQFRKEQAAQQQIKQSDYFTKTVACRGEVYFKYVAEKPNQIKEHLIHRAKGPEQGPPTFMSSASIEDNIQDVRGNYQHPLAATRLDIAQLQPFFCDINDLNEGGLSVQYLNKRQMIYPFNLGYGNQEIIECQQKRITNVIAQNQEISSAALHQQLMEDDNFLYFQKTQFDLDLTEIHVSFNDLIIVQGIIKKLQQLNDEFKVSNQRGGESKEDDKHLVKIKEEEGEESADSGESGEHLGSSNLKDKQSEEAKEIYLQGYSDGDDSDYAHVDRPSEQFIPVQSSHQPAAIEAPDSIHEILQESSLKQRREAKKHISAVSNSQRSPRQSKHAKFEQPKDADSKAKGSRPDSQRGIDEVAFISKGLKLIVINDRDSNFLPIISLNSSPFQIQVYMHSQQSTIQTVFKLSLNFFNVNIGMWEPFMEKFNFEITSTQDIVNKKLIMNLDFPKPVNMNFTEKLIENLHESHKSWNICQEEYQQFEQESQKNHEAGLNSQEQEYDVGNFAQSLIDLDTWLGEPKMSVVDAKLRKTISRPRSYKEDGQTQPRLTGQASSLNQNNNEDMISPYVIVNKTDLTIFIKRLFKREEADKYQYSDFLHERTSRSQPQNDPSIQAVQQYDADQALSQSPQAADHKNLVDLKQSRAPSSISVVQQAKGLQNMYKLAQGQIVDYMVDYDATKNLSEVEQLLRGSPSGDKADDDLLAQSEEEIHNDHIGEYKSEFMKIQFDKTSAEVQHNRALFDENKEIAKIDLNRLGYQAHVIRDGANTEKIFYGCKLIDCKKVFTVRSQYQIVNFTGFDYLIYFKYKNSYLIKYLESGDSLAVSKRYDEFKLQIKMIDGSEQEQNQGDDETERASYPEELQVQQELVEDMRSSKYDFKNWSSLIPLSVLKNKLKLEDSSYLTNGTSLYTFIRKTQSDILANEQVIDINLMPPMILKNCLPFAIKLTFYDSSDVLQEITFKKEEEKNLFCFSMAKSAHVDISIPDFETVKGFKLFNLERYRSMEDVIQIFDRYGRSTLIYSQIQRKQAGQRIIFYCKKMMIDSIDSELIYYYKRPDAFSSAKDMMRNMIPFVNLGAQRQKIYIIPEGQGFNEIYVALSRESSKSEFVKMDIDATATQLELHLKNFSNNMNFCYSSEVYLATQNEYIYTKITTVSPYYVVVNESKQTIIMKQSEIPELDKDQQYLPLILEPGQRQAYQFYKFQTKYHGQDEFVQIKVCDEQIPLQMSEKELASGGGAEHRNASFSKQYSWSCPFQISSVAQFTVKLGAHELDDQSVKRINALPNTDQKSLLQSVLQEDQFLRVTCKTDQGDCLGSMFIVIRDEVEQKCEYRIINESENIDLIYKQFIDKSKTPQKYAQISLPESAQSSKRLKVGQDTRFCWSSVLHGKLLALSFTSTFKSFSNAKLLLQELTEEQRHRLISKCDILIPLDKIGLSENLSLVQVPDHGVYKELKNFAVDAYAKVRVSITTNGFSKILKIQDYIDDHDHEVVPHFESRHDLHKYLNPSFQALQMSTVSLSVNQMCMSFIHKKRELLTVFISKIKTILQDSEAQTKVKFNIGYLQIDNQSENEPTYAVVMKPRDLFIKDGEIMVKIEETEKERQEREQFGLDGFTNENARMFMSEVVINKKANQKDVVYIESIVFLMQTLHIQIQFSHFLKVASFVYHLGKVLNKGVTKVHYVFEEQGRITTNAEGEKTVIDYGDTARQKKKDRLDNFKKQDVLVGSKVRAQTQRKIDAVKMSNTDNNWQFSSKMVAQSSWRIYIENYQSSPVELIVSAVNERLKKDKKNGQAPDQNFDEVENQRQLIQNGLAQQDEANDDGDDVIGVFGARDEQFARRFLYFSTFEDMLFQMNGLNISNLFGEGNEVLSQLATFHKETFKYNALRLLGSSNLIGNPSRYVGNMGTGVTDFFVKPFQGMKDGSIVQAADGFAQGSKSLLKNTFMAPVGALSKFGNSLSKGALALSFDDQFIEAKNYDNQKNKPKNVGDGLVKGFSSAGSSVLSGVAGVFTKPVEGAKQAGVGGFFKGIGKGAAGLVTKTVSGTIDIVAKTTEGLDNQTKSSSLLASTRIRNPRPFYEIHHLIRPFNEMHANWQHAVPQVTKGVDLTTIYDIFEIMEYPKIGVVTVPPEKRGGASTEKHVKTCKYSVFVVTKYFIAELHHTVGVDMESQVDIRSSAIRPDPNGKMQKDGTGSKITIEAIYLMKHLAFVELLNQSVVMLGYKYNQRENMAVTFTQAGYPVTHILIDDTGENVKRSKAKPKGAPARADPGLEKLLRASPALKRQTPEQTSALKEALFNKYFEELDRESAGQLERGVSAERVHSGEYFLMMNFPEESRALETSKRLDRIRQLLRQEAKSERAEQEAASAQQKARHEGWQEPASTTSESHQSQSQR